MPELQLEHLWAIYDLDNEWNKFSALKDNLMKEFSNLAPSL